MIQDNYNNNFGGKSQLSVNEIHLKKYSTHIVKLFEKYLDESHKVIDFGAGCGTLADLWTLRNKKKPICIEIDPALRKVILEKGYTCHAGLGDITGNIRAVYTSNVLEHIEQDSLAIKSIFDILEHHGKLAIYVPALMCLYSEHDKAVGHYRRYSKQELIRKVQAAGFSVLKCHYVDSIGFLAAYLTKHIGYQNKAGLGCSKSLKIYDKYFFPISRLLDLIGLRYFLGKNIFLYAKKP